MNDYVAHFVSLYQENDFWSIYPEEAKGFTAEEIHEFSTKLNINMFDELEQFLLHFGKCGAGIFTDDLFWFYNYYENGLDDYISMNKAWIDDMIDEGVFDESFREKKPLFFGDYDNCVFYFVFTNDENKKVWEYNETEEILKQLDYSFFEFLEYYVSLPSVVNSYRNIVFTKEQVLHSSKTRIF